MSIGMDRKFAFCTLVMATVLGLSAVLHGQHGADVKYRDGRGKEKEEKSVQIVEHTFHGLKIKFSGTGRPDKVVSEDELISVTYANTPDAYRAGVDAYLDGEFTTALNKLRALLDDDRTLKARAWVKQDALYYAMESARRLRDIEAAKEFEAELLKEEPKSRWIPTVKMRGALDMMAQEKFSEAVAAFKRLRQDAESGGWAKSQIVLAGLGEAEALLNFGKAAEASAVLEQIKPVAAATVLESLDQRIKILEGRVLLKSNKVSEAKSLFVRILESAKPSEKVLVAGAANGKGDCDFEANAFEDAMYDYSMTASIYYDDPDMESEVGWALWMWGNACKRAANAIQDQNDENKKTYTKRYKSLLKQAAEEFPGTRGGMLSLKELGQ